MSFLLDTDTCSACLRDVTGVTNRLVQYAGRLYISALTLGELFTWVKRRHVSVKRLESLRELIDGVTVLSVDTHIAERLGTIRAVLLDVPRPTPTIDLFIAATALEYDLTLVTHNLRDFEHIPDLRLEDWLAD